MSDILDRLGSGELFPVVIVSIVFGSLLLLSVFAIIAACAIRFAGIATINTNNADANATLFKLREGRVIVRATALLGWG